MTDFYPPNYLSLCFSGLCLYIFDSLGLDGLCGSLRGLSDNFFSGGGIIGMLFKGDKLINMFSSPNNSVGPLTSTFFLVENYFFRFTFIFLLYNMGIFMKKKM